MYDQDEFEYSNNVIFSNNLLQPTKIVIRFVEISLH